MILGVNETVRALLSPRVLRREAISGTESDLAIQSERSIKDGNVTILQKVDEAFSSEQKVYMDLVKERVTLVAKFYADSNKTFLFGRLDLNKCQILPSETDAKVIKIIHNRDKTPSGGMFIKLRSEEESLKWMTAMDHSVEVTGR